MYLHFNQGSQRLPDTISANFYDTIVNLNTQATVVSCLILGISHTLAGGVPITLVTTVFNTAKKLILGNQRVEEDE